MELSQVVLDSTVNNTSASFLLHDYMNMFSNENATYVKQREAEEKRLESLNAIHDVAKRLKENVLTIGEMEQSFSKFINEIEELKKSNNRLNEETDKLRQVLNSITAQLLSIQDVSAQTNLLSMNASIEAARAGSAGVGFRVIANEVKKLSETSDKNSKVIEENIENFKNKLNDLVNENKKGTSMLDSLKSVAEETGEILQGIGRQSSENADLTQTEVEKINKYNNILLEVSKEIENETIAKIKKLSDNAASNIYNVNDRVSLILEIKSIFTNLLAEV